MMPYLSDIDAMQLAFKQAQLAELNGEVPVGAVIVRDGKVLGRGFNTPIAAHDPSAHAEIIAMRDAGDSLQNYRLNGCTIYVTLEPCAMCATAMLHARLARLVFSAWDTKAGAIVSCDNLFEKKWTNHRITWSSGVMHKECAALLKNFFAARREG